MQKKPKVFIASSAESLEVAEAINSNLDHDTEATLWKDAFQLSSTTLAELIERTKLSDFAVFIFTPDDKVSIRNIDTNVVRDNVLFELGLFIGKLGPERCFIVKPRNVNLKLPTDLAGVTFADYETERSDKNITAAVTSACTKIKQSIKKLGYLQKDKKKLITNNTSFDDEIPNDFIESDGIIWRLEKTGNIEKYVEYCPDCGKKMCRTIDFVTCKICNRTALVGATKPSKLPK